MGFSRRKFLKGFSAAAGATVLSDVITPFASKFAYAAAECRSTNQNTVLFLNLGGGADFANVLVPKTSSAYFAKRPALGIRSPLSLNGETDFGIHPLLPKFQQLYNAGNVAFITKVGHPNFSTSHASAVRNYARGLLGNNTDTTGWAGRVADTLVDCKASDDYSILSLSGRSRDIEAQKFVPIVASKLAFFSLQSNYSAFRAGDHEDQFKYKMMDETLKLETQKTDMQKSYKASYDKISSTGETLNAASANYNPSGYPETGIGNSFKEFARLIKYGIHPKIVYTEQGGYDTHEAQTLAFVTLMTNLNAAIDALVEDLKSMGQFDNVIISIESEFSRRLYENTNRNPSGLLIPGTDHGGAILNILIGGKVKGGIYGPGWLDSDFATQEVFPYAIDYREIRSRLVEWLGVDPAIVFPEEWVNSGTAAHLL